jgi:hypothetical protein
MGYRKDAERFKGTTGGICMSFLFQTEDPLCGGGVVLRIWNIPLSDCMENPG